VLSERIDANERFRRAEAKHERQMRRMHEKFIAREYRQDRLLDDDHFERLNHADQTAAAIAEEVKSVAKETATNTVSRDRYEADRAADAELLMARIEAQRLKDTNAATITTLKQGQSEGRQQVFGMSETAFRALVTLGGAVLLVATLLRLFGVTL